MISSIVLLLVLQVFWLKSAYRDAADNFRKETNSIFRNTIFAMHDSLVQRSLQPMAGDSSRKFLRPKRFFVKDSLAFASQPPDDSLYNYINIKERSARIEVIMSSEPGSDSLQKILRPLISKMQMNKQPKTFILRLGADTLQVDSITYFFDRALSEAGFHIPFKIIAMRNERGARTGKLTADGNKVFTSEVVRLNPMNHYAVTFSGIDGLLLKEIAPQILFSVFLTLLTIGSFYLMYRSLRTQQRLMAIKNDFISNVTHELKTPVATVSVALEALKNFNALDDPQRTSEYLEIAQNELNRLTLMTDKILKTAVFEENGVTLKIEKIDLDGLIQQILSSMKLVFEKRKTQLQYQKDGKDFTVEGSQAHITNVIYNLLDNALKYSGEPSQVDVTLREDGDKIAISVRDSGIGIASEYQKKIFEKFFRVPSGDIHNTKGYGLGLSYVASVMKSHRGEITVESEPGKGSCFTLVIPKLHEN